MSRWQKRYSVRRVTQVDELAQLFADIAGSGALHTISSTVAVRRPDRGFAHNEWTTSTLYWTGSDNAYQFSLAICGTGRD
jgi:hypothetical protein